MEPVRCLITDGPVTSLLFIKNWLISGTVRGTISFWNVRSWKEESVVELPGRIPWIQSIERLNSMVLTQPRSETNEIYVLGYENGWKVAKTVILSNPHRGFCPGRVHHDDNDDNNNILAIPADEADIRIYDIDDWSPKSVLSPTSKVGNVMNFEFVDQNRIVSVYEIGRIVCWNLDTETQMSSLQLCTSPLMTLDVKLNDEVYAGVVGGPENQVISFQLDDMTLTKIGSRSLPTNGIADVKIRTKIPGKRIIVAGSWDSTIRLFSWNNPRAMKPLGALKFHTDTIECVALSPEKIKIGIDKKYLIAAGSKDERISIWDVYNE